ncbi:MAG: hypothetical protein WC314_09500 [Vulcanimicrobiota bacterium]
MKRDLWLLTLLVLALFAATAARPSEYLIVEGGQSNVFLDDEQAQVHLLLRDGRLVFAFPAENSGVGLWFDGVLEIVPETLKSLPAGPASQQVEVRLRVLEPTAVRDVVLDSIRVLRDHSEGADTAAKVEAARRALGADGAETTRKVKLREDGLSTISYERSQRHTPSGAGLFRLTLLGEVAGDEELVLQSGLVTVTAQLPFPKQPGFSANELYRPEYLRQLSRTPGRVDDSLRALEFLARKEKLMAGSWRFLTYFGRDTLISLAMLEPILSDEALIAGVESVLVRLSADGMVAHEEDIGPWAEWRWLEAGQAAHGMDPVYDHKMVDDDLLLPVLFTKLRSQGREAVVQKLLQDPKSRRAILLNADYVLELLARKELVRLNPGESTGDWRDSHEGLGGGAYPASVNAHLVLPALDALEMIYRSTGADGTKIARVRDLRPPWEKLAGSYWVELTPQQVEESLQRFAEDLNPVRRVAFEKLVQARLDLLQRPFRFPVLSFNDDGSPVLVPHTDVAFTLFYGTPNQAELTDILTLLERPFPYGLSTPAGHLVASPVFSSDSEHYQSLGFGQYHGLVVWSWPSAMLQLGLMQQLQRYPELDERIRGLLEQIEASEQRVGPLATSELWAIDLGAEGIVWRAYGVAGDQAESNALQLWSTVYPALVRARATLLSGRK